MIFTRQTNNRLQCRQAPRLVTPREADTHGGFGRRVELQPALRLLSAELPQGEDALGHRALLGVVRLQPQHQSAAAQLLQVQREHEGLHEGHVLQSGEPDGTSFP